MSRKPPKKIIHINQHIIKRNRKTGECEPVITCKTYKDNRYGHEVIIKDKDGDERTGPYREHARRYAGIAPRGNDQ